MNLFRHLLFAAVLLFSDSSIAAEEATITIYLAREADVCPAGYSHPQKCPRFTADRFEELRAKRALRRLGSPKTIVLDRISSEPLNVQLGEELGVIRRYRTAGSQTVALISVEWRKSELPSPSMTPAYQPTESAEDDIITNTVENRRAFSHGNVRNLDPEERYVWPLSRGGRPLSLIFE